MSVTSSAPMCNQKQAHRKRMKKWCLLIVKIYLSHNRGAQKKICMRSLPQSCASKAAKTSILFTKGMGHSSTHWIHWNSKWTHHISNRRWYHQSQLTVMQPFSVFSKLRKTRGLIILARTSWAGHKWGDITKARPLNPHRMRSRRWGSSRRAPSVAIKWI